MKSFITKSFCIAMYSGLFYFLARVLFQIDANYELSRTIITVLSGAVLLISSFIQGIKESRGTESQREPLSTLLGVATLGMFLIIAGTSGGYSDWNWPIWVMRSCLVVWLTGCIACSIVVYKEKSF